MSTHRRGHKGGDQGHLHDGFARQVLLLKLRVALQALKRYLFLAVGGAAMLAVVRPPLPIRGGARCPRLPWHLCPRLWDESHVPAHDADDVNIYGEGAAWREHWGLWLLPPAVLLAVLAASSRPRAPCCLHACLRIL